MGTAKTVISATCDGSVDQYCQLQSGDSTLWGERVTNNESVEYCAYNQIPYAEAPVEKLRFLKAKIMTELPSNGSYCTNSTIQCTQEDEQGDIVAGQEDCLYLNVFTKWGGGGEEPVNTQLKPVLLWIHGGSFMVGSAFSDNFNPASFIEEDIVVVSFNYRLHLFGFLPIPTDHNYSLNLGLEDQKVVLEWIQRHIRVFGGDPNRVCIMGWSAGSASVHYLMYDEDAKGLFHSAIAMSGSFLSPWAYSQNGSEFRKIICDHFLVKNCSIDGITGTFGASLKYLILFENLDREMMSIIWGSREYNFRPNFGTLSDYPESRLGSGFFNDVPLLMGVTNNELREFGLDLDALEQSTSHFPNPDARVLDKIMSMLRKIGEQSSTELNQHLSYANMYHGVYKFLELHAKRSEKDMFFYQLNYNPTEGTTSNAEHSDTIDLLFGKCDSKVPSNARVAKYMQKIWANFVWNQ